MAIYRKGLWSPDEDEKLKSYILRYGHGCWSSLPAKAGLQRNGKSCRLRWINYLRPGLKRGVFTDKEDETILTLQRSLGNKWSQMAQKLPGRTDNEIKNYWHSYLKKQRPTKTSDSTASAGSQETTNEVSSLDAVPKVFSQDDNIPKVLFAEWFSPDHHGPSQNYLHSMNTAVSLGDTPDDSLGGYSNEYADAMAMHHELNTTTTVGKFQQVQNGSTSEIYDDFKIYDDLNYM